MLSVDDTDSCTCEMWVGNVFALRTQVCVICSYLLLLIMSVNYNNYSDQYSNRGNWIRSSISLFENISSSIFYFCLI
jgi:hypothetical protein